MSLKETPQPTRPHLKLTSSTLRSRSPTNRSKWTAAPAPTRCSAFFYIFFSFFYIYVEVGSASKCKARTGPSGGAGRAARLAQGGELGRESSQELVSPFPATRRPAAQKLLISTWLSARTPPSVGLGRSTVEDGPEPSWPPFSASSRRR